jgi:hypothetical protein
VNNTAVLKTHLADVLAQALAQALSVQHTAINQSSTQPSIRQYTTQSCSIFMEDS